MHMPSLGFEQQTQCFPSPPPQPWRGKPTAYSDCFLQAGTRWRRRFIHYEVLKSAHVDRIDRLILHSECKGGTDVKLFIGLILAAHER